MSKYRRIGAASLQHRTSRAPSGADAEREAVVRSIARAGELGVDVLLFQEEYGFVPLDPVDAPDRANYAPSGEVLTQPAEAPASPEERAVTAVACTSATGRRTAS